MDEIGDGSIPPVRSTRRQWRPGCAIAALVVLVVSIVILADTIGQIREMYKLKVRRDGVKLRTMTLRDAPTTIFRLVCEDPADGVTKTADLLPPVYFDQGLGRLPDVDKLTWRGPDGKVASPPSGEAIIRPEYAVR